MHTAKQSHVNQVHEQGIGNTFSLPTAHQPSFNRPSNTYQPSHQSAISLLQFHNAASDHTYFLT
ncbi:hypothetical protein [Bifidobacterium oedipodis]|uniref:hypothetical protein n=1 Tax=Bifidobacterium oedipodis TaxID=2675322 RepID=UPI00145E4B6A|nr:hypothetical protein [Bifidobacterium sp. DSM 109957]